MLQTNIENPNIESQTNRENHARDYEYALVIGLIIGIALLPTLNNLQVLQRFNGVSQTYVHAAIVLGLPILALAGVFVARLIFSRITILWQFVKFGLIGVSNTALNFGVLNLMVQKTNITRGLTYDMFAALAFLVALINSYVWNSHWSFQNNNARTAKEFFQFFLVTFVGLLINVGVNHFVTSNVSPVAGLSAVQWDNIANLIATLVVMFWNFSGFKFFVFKK